MRNMKRSGETWKAQKRVGGGQNKGGIEVRTHSSVNRKEKRVVLDIKNTLEHRRKRAE